MILAKCGIKIKFEIIQQTKIRTNQGIILECRVRPHYSWCLHRTKAHNSFEYLKSARETRKFKRIFAKILLQKAAGFPIDSYILWRLWSSFSRED